MQENKLIGNQNAAKESPATSWIQVRVTPTQKAGFVKKAQAEGLNLSAWVLKKLQS